MEKSFVILEHTCSGAVHYDFMLEAGDVLATWQFERNPAGLEVGCELICKKIQDHRLAYLTYEGEISGGRGLVKRVAQGSYQQIEVDEACWRFKMSGQLMRGNFLLTKSSLGNSDQWILTREDVSIIPT